ncbi:M15 family metallopeptidase [Cupriavidus sp. AU9028]|uniref:M15 family metallopeptidase n=1 Tax=Cupriavidus sp. AU9028 TaxID=2871157 RepID=UPI001C953AAF|nr:M15 family metallopeptidase [Cupriavidus sp. AU9028]MBY4897538.1 M15 family metallopeptidase [Cupriavidus sp. AU9028]
MIAVTLLCYFAVAVAVAAMLLLPDVRLRVLRFARSGWQRLSSNAGLAGRRSAGTLRVTAIQAADSADALREFIARRKIFLICATGVVVTPPIIAFALRPKLVFEYDDALRDPDQKISALLNGERLIPPAPLPPEVFTTREVERLRPAIREASRNWELLDDDFRQRLLLVFKLMRDQHGYEMVLLEGYRSPERQARLAAMGAHVTQAGAYHSYHQFGLAADSAFFREGKLVISEKDPWAMRGYELYGQIAESAGLTWGGRWKMMDLGHVELRRPGVLGKKPR